jgi:sterol 24-C-methyltransferase
MAATVASSQPQHVPAAPYLLNGDTSDTPRSSNTSSDEKVNLSAGSGRKSSSRPHGNQLFVDRSASPNRWKTFRTSFKYLCNLTPKQVDDFMASYVIYNLDWENETEMISALGPNYQQLAGDCLKSYYGVMNHLYVFPTSFLSSLS